MKLFWMGLGLLLVLLALSVWGWFAVEDIHEPIRQNAEAAAEAVLAGDWEQASALLQQAKSAWDHTRRLTAALSGHNAIEEMDGLFAQAELYTRLRDQTRCAAACRDLAGLAEASAEAHRLTWWNLL